MPPPAEADEGTARTPSSQPFSNYEKEGLLNLQILNEQIQEVFTPHLNQPKPVRVLNLAQQNLLSRNDQGRGRGVLENLSRVGA